MKKDPYIRDQNVSFLLNSHAVLVDHIAANVQKMYEGLNLYDHRHRVAGDVHEQDFGGKLVILRDTVLNEASRTPENQLFFCTGGFGSSPHARGRTVFGEFLIDGEKARFERQDFVGLCDGRYLADWAKEKLQALTGNDEQAASDASEIKMKGV